MTKACYTPQGKLSMDNLAQGIDFHQECISEVAIELVTQSPKRVGNFISKYEEFINLVIDRVEGDQIIFKLGASSQKEIARICGIMSEDIDVISIDILS